MLSHHIPMLNLNEAFFSKHKMFCELFSYCLHVQNETLAGYYANSRTARIIRSRSK